MKQIQVIKSLRYLTIHDVEFQFDRRAVSLQFSATQQRVDFRDFMKDISAFAGAQVRMTRFSETYNFAPKKFAEIGLSTGAVYL
jgi:cell fate regulator YaaT (PSP1 superfamily)